MKTFALISAAAVLLAVSSLPSHAGDKNSIWFSQRSNLAGVGFTGTACGKLPLPWVEVDGEGGCAKVPTTFMYKKTTSEGTTIKEVRKLEDTHTESITENPDGSRTMSLKVVSGRSVDGNFGRRQSFSLLGATFGNAESASGVSRTFSTGLAAARRSTQDPVSAPE